jgi:large subunit ribosomal protein L20
MARVSNAAASRKRRKRRLKLASGFKGKRSKLFRTATEAVNYAQAQGTAHRKQKKRQYRSLWIVRISAACRLHGISYSRFMEGVHKAKIAIDRKMLSEIAVNDPAAFTAIVAQAKG